MHLEMYLIKICKYQLWLHIQYSSKNWQGIKTIKSTKYNTNNLNRDKVYYVPYLFRISMKFPNTEAPPNVFDSMDHTSKISILNLFYKYGMKRTSLVVYLLESIMGDRDMFDLGIVKEFESYTDSLEFQNIAKPSKFAVFSQIDTKHLFILYKVIDNILDSAKQSSNNLENYMTEIEKEFIRRNKMIVFMKYNKIKINEFKNSLVSYPNDLLVFLKTSHKYLRAIHEEDLHKDLLKVHLLYAHKLPNIIFTMSLKEWLESIEYLVKIKDLIVAMNWNASEIKTIVKKFEDEFYTNVQKKICKDNDIGMHWHHIMLLYTLIFFN